MPGGRLKFLNLHVCPVSVLALTRTECGSGVGRQEGVQCKHQILQAPDKTGICQKAGGNQGPWPLAQRRPGSLTWAGMPFGCVWVPDAPAGSRQKQRAGSLAEYTSTVALTMAGITWSPRCSLVFMFCFPLGTLSFPRCQPVLLPLLICLCESQDLP